MVRDGKIELPGDPTKDDLRRVNQLACQKKSNEARPRLARYEARLLARIASGDEVVPEDVQPKLVQVKRGSEDELLFRYACLHWSIPVSSGYGRRLRFLVTDESNNKLIGILGLGDPVYALSARDNWVGFSGPNPKRRLHNIVDAFVLGAVPPYSQLLAGKLVAMLAASNEVRGRFREKA